MVNSVCVHVWLCFEEVVSRMCGSLSNLEKPAEFHYELHINERLLFLTDFPTPLQLSKVNLCILRKLSFKNSKREIYQFKNVCIRIKATETLLKLFCPTQTEKEVSCCRFVSVVLQEFSGDVINLINYMCS